MKRWLLSENVSDELKSLLKSYNEKQLNKALSTRIEFGTAGMRGTMGAGYGYINENTINWATIGYAKYLNANFKSPKVVIAYDNRKNSKAFATLCAKILSSSDIEVYIFNELKSTPQLSFTIRMLNAHGGINITASHNPKTDNGYKLYNQHGGQYLPDDIDLIKEYINQIDSCIDIAICTTENNELIHVLNDDSHFINLIDQNVSSNFDNYEKILISPLHGCGSILKEINKVVGFKNIYYVDKQMDGDENFTTAPEPNPDSKIAYEYALDNNNDNCNYIIANDPDADRVGIFDVKNDFLYSGNQLATLLVYYMLTTNQYKENQTIIASNVSSDLPVEIAKSYNLNTKTVLTGFKWIGDILNDTFFMGYEESNGYLIHQETRDKDGISAAFKLIEMINHYYNNDTTLNEVLNEIYTKYGYYVDSQISLVVDDMCIVDNVIKNINISTFNNVKYIEDFNSDSRMYNDYNEQIGLPKNNMIKVFFNDNSWFAIRPSGTEPKIKIYINTIGATKQEANNKMEEIKKLALNLFK